MYSLLKNNLLRILVYSFSVFFLYAPPLDPDLWWHLRYGQYFLLNHKLLSTNILTYVFEDYSWANSYWFAQLILYKLFSIDMGISLSLVLSIIFVLIASFILHKSVGKMGSYVYISLLLLTFALGFFNVTVRPLYFSSVFTLILVSILLYMPKYIKYLPLLFLLWANMHADFVLGIALFGAYVVFTSFSKRMILWVPTIILVVSILATFINPYGTTLHSTLLGEGNITNIIYIGEFKAPSNAEGIALLVIASIFVGCAFYQKSKQPLWYLISLCIFLSGGLISAYFIRILLLLGIFSFNELFSVVLAKKLVILESYFDVLRAKLLYVSPLILVVLVIGFLTTTLQIAIPEEAYKRAGYPFQAVTFIKDNQLNGRMFNNYSWGGYLSWFLPDNGLFIDGRMASWQQGDVRILDDYINLTLNPYKNSELVDEYFIKYDITMLLHKPDVPLVTYLLEQKNWHIAYRDETAIVLTK